MQLEYMYIKNLGRLWLAYTELQGEFYMLQLMTDDSMDSGHFTQQGYTKSGWAAPRVWCQ